MNPAVFFRSRSQSRHKTFTMRGQPSTPRNRTAQFAVSPTAAALASMAQSDRDPCDLDTLIQRFGKHLLQPKRKNSNRKFVPDDLARAMDAHLQSTGLCPEGRVEKEPCQQFVQMIHRPAHDLQWSFADPLFWNTKKPRTTTVYTERSAEEYRAANWIELQGEFLTRNTSFNTFPSAPYARSPATRHAPLHATSFGALRAHPPHDTPLHAHPSRDPPLSPRTCHAPTE